MIRVVQSGAITTSIAYDAQVTKYCNVAAAAFLVYDMFIHMGDEVELIWKSRNTWVKWIYIYVRHYSILVVGLLLIHGNSRVPFTHQSCINWLIAESVFSNSIVSVTELVLLIRLFAIYGKSKLILGVLSIASLAEMITVTIATVKSFNGAEVSLELGCVLLYVPPILTAGWAASLAFQTLIFALTVGRWLTHLMVTKQLGRQSIMFVFMRDGGWAYGLMLIVCLVNLLTFRLKSSPLSTVAFRWVMAVASFSGSHVLLNLRRIGRDLHEDFMSRPDEANPTDAEAIVFAPLSIDTSPAPLPTQIELEIPRTRWRDRESEYEYSLRSEV
ncbi:hypothetical protein BXZ70DRAFT_13294 [Cristinia sonorae]|uniref:DUF6533 domain-containing protein n=1 Tax=Cristinia sonorae TaxID=1940300 RepID=A0A8K0UZD1_9AGAR|nr:hypothetical protein BXZ70DRAFT_13294 [Cristinia sonorae]